MNNLTNEQVKLVGYGGVGVGVLCGLASLYFFVQAIRIQNKISSMGQSGELLKSMGASPDWVTPSILLVIAITAGYFGFRALGKLPQK